MLDFCISNDIFFEKLLEFGELCKKGHLVNIHSKIAYVLCISLTGTSSRMDLTVLDKLRAMYFKRYKLLEILLKIR